MNIHTAETRLAVVLLSFTLGSASECTAEAAATVAPATTAAPAIKPPPVDLVNALLRKTFPAASAWDAGGEVRSRYELKGNAGSYANRDFARNLDNSNDFFLFRAKLHLGWTPLSWFNVFAEGREAYAASDTRPVTETDNLDLHQAYLRLGDPKLFPVSLKAGRQELIYGDQRYIGNADWSNLQRSFDAVKLRFENELFWVDAFTAHLVIPYNLHFNQSNDHDWFSGMYASTRKLAPWQDTEVYFLARNVGPKSPTAITPTLGGPGERDIYTVGTRWKSAPGMLGNWDYAAEVAGQFGTIYQGVNRLDHRALAVNVSGAYTWKDTFGAPRLGLGYDYGSGDSNPLDDTNETFELLFGTNHRLYGNMDLMGLRNMHIPRLEAAMKPSASVTIALEWLAFWLADTADFFYPESGAGRNQNGYGRNPGYSSWVGQEVDLLVDWRVAPWGLLRAGYGHFFVGDYIRQSIDSVSANGGAVDANWVYLQATLRF